MIGSLDQVAAFLRVDCYGLAAPELDRTTNVVNGASRVITGIFGEEVDRHARTARP